jgi:hypothetical protein
MTTVTSIILEFSVVGVCDAAANKREHFSRLFNQSFDMIIIEFKKAKCVSQFPMFLLVGAEMQSEING